MAWPGSAGPISLSSTAIEGLSGPISRTRTADGIIPRVASLNRPHARGCGILVLQAHQRCLPAQQACGRTGIARLCVIGSIEGLLAIRTRRHLSLQALIAGRPYIGQNPVERGRSAPTLRTR